MRLVKQGPDPGLELLPPGHVVGEVSVLVPEFLGELLFSRFVRLNIKLKEKPYIIGNWKDIRSQSRENLMSLLIVPGD